MPIWLLEFIRDPGWQFLGVVITLAGVLVAILTIKHQRKAEKILSYNILSNTPLLTLADKSERRLRILFEDKEIRNAHLILIEIANVGDLAIIPDDYYEQLSLIFGESGEVISPELISQEPENLGIEAPRIDEANKNKMEFKPMLLNPGEKFTLKTIVTDLTGEVIAHARIINGRITKGPIVRKSWLWTLRSINTIAFVAGVIGGFILIQRAPYLLDMAARLVGGFVIGYHAVRVIARGLTGLLRK